MSAHWDKIAVSSPLNRTAGLVTSRSRGMSPVGPKAESPTLHWDVPPPLSGDCLASNQADLTGRTVGRLRVIGHLGKGRWLTRCACGDYEPRTAKAIGNPANAADCCRICRHNEYLRNNNTSGTHRRDGSRAGAA